MRKCSLCDNPPLYFVYGEMFCGVHKGEAVKRLAVPRAYIRKPPLSVEEIRRRQIVEHIIRRRKQL